MRPSAGMKRGPHCITHLPGKEEYKQSAGAFSHLWHLLKMKIDLKLRSEVDIFSKGVLSYTMPPTLLRDKSPKYSRGSVREHTQNLRLLHK